MWGGPQNEQLQVMYISNPLPLTLISPISDPTLNPNLFNRNYPFVWSCVWFSYPTNQHLSRNTEINPPKKPEGWELRPWSRRSPCCTNSFGPSRDLSVVARIPTCHALWIRSSVESVPWFLISKLRCQKSRKCNLHFRPPPPKRVGINLNWYHLITSDWPGGWQTKDPGEYQQPSILPIRLSGKGFSSW